HAERGRRDGAPEKSSHADHWADEELHLWNALPGLYLLIVAFRYRRCSLMLKDSMRPLARRALIVDDELAQATTAGGRAIQGLASELRARGVDVVPALS